MPQSAPARVLIAPEIEQARNAAARTSVAVASTLLVLKALFALWTGSLVIVASCLDSLLDVFASGVNWVVIRTAQTPPDKEHPFGHGKAEYLGGLFQALVIGISGLFVLGEAVRRLSAPVPVTHTAEAIGLMAAGTAASAYVVWRLRSAARATHSPALRADSVHYLTDVYTNSGALGALALVLALDSTLPDTLAGFAIAALVLYSAFDVLKESINGLMDHQLPDGQIRDIRRMILEHPDVVGIHDLRARRSGADKFVQVHVEMDGTMSFERAHQIAEHLTTQIEGYLHQAFVIVHADPVEIGPGGEIIARPPVEPPPIVVHGDETR